MPGIRSIQPTNILVTLMVCASLFASFFSGPIWGQSTELADFRMQHVVLRTGSVFSGIVERSSDLVTVRSQNGIVVKLTRSEVDFVTDSIDYAADRLANRIVDDNSRSHLSMAQWCLRYGALAAAQREIKWLSTSDIGQSDLRELQRRLDMAMSPAVPNASDPVPRGTAQRNPSDSSGTISHSEHFLVRQQLQTALDSIPRDARRDFTNTVHIRILNGCAAAQCHGNPSTPMRLWRDDQFTGLDSTSTQRNLLAILNQVDRKTPENSILLTYMTTAHGGQEEPVFVQDSPEWNDIRKWLTDIVIAEHVAEHITEDTAAQVSQTSFENPPGIDKGTLAIASQPPRPVDLLSNAGKAELSSDPFDPEHFNRTYSRPNLTSPQPFHAPDSPRRVTEPDRRPLPPVATPEPAASIAPTTRTTRPLPPVDDDND